MFDSNSIVIIVGSTKVWNIDILLHNVLNKDCNLGIPNLGIPVCRPNSPNMYYLGIVGVPFWNFGSANIVH